MWVRIPPAAPERRERLLPALFVAAARGIWYNVVKPARPAGDSFAASQLSMGKEGWKTI